MSRPCILLVEGSDDQHTVWELAKHYQLPKVFVVEALNGIDMLLESLPLQIKASDLKRLGVLVDADTDLAARWQALRNILVHAGFTVPRLPTASGTILHQEDLPIVGIWLMPDNRLPGMLENFIAGMIPGEDPLWPRAQMCVDQIPPEERRFPTERETKAQIHTWLAWQEEPGRPMGLAITARYLDPDVTEARTFIAWLRHLFEND